MQLLPSLLFGVSASLDSLLVGISFGLRRVRILLWQNLLISLVTFLGTCLSALLGARLLPLLPSFPGRFIGSLVLILLGIYYIAKQILFTLRNRHPADAGSDKQPVNSCRKTLNPQEIAFLSLSLSVNNMGIGFSASLAGLLPVSAAVSTFSCSVLFLLAGNRLGRSRFLRFIGEAADPLSGLLLIGLGVLQLVF
ncbi:MAG: manganese efflux pump [Roseburia sp.]|nr:manganese efflux pump [Roseburia sp.]MCM1098749.1 manganese efflux pump [Ruminococcus flavefaciens]